MLYRVFKKHRRAEGFAVKTVLCEVVVLKIDSIGQ